MRERKGKILCFSFSLLSRHISFLPSSRSASLVVSSLCSSSSFFFSFFLFLTSLEQKERERERKRGVFLPSCFDSILHRRHVCPEPKMFSLLSLNLFPSFFFLLIFLYRFLSLLFSLSLSRSSSLSFEFKRELREKKEKETEGKKDPNNQHLFFSS